MDEKQLMEGLKDLPLDEIRYLKSVESTNDYAAEWLLSGVKGINLVVANEQTAGRGRMGRTWLSTPDKSLAFSVILKTNPKENVNVALHSPLGAVAVCSVIEDEYKLKPEVKWPNDVLLDERKVCGVLAEAVWEENRLLGIVLGIGINLLKNSAPNDRELLFTATCLGDFLLKEPDPVIFLKCVLQKIIYWKEKLYSDIFLNYWDSHLAYKGRVVKIIQQDLPAITGLLLGVAKDGCLRIELDSGIVRLVTIGDLHLRSGGG